MIVEYLSDNEKIDFITECLRERHEDNPLAKILTVSTLSTILIIVILFILDASTLIEYPYIAVAVFLTLTMALSILEEIGLTPALVYQKYLVKVSNKNLIVKMYSIVNIESTFMYPLDNIGGIGIGERTEKIKCGKTKTKLKGKVIEIFNKNGKRIFEFGFWLNEYDLIRLYEDLAAVLSLKYQNRMKR